LNPLSAEVAFDQDKDWIDLGEMIAIQAEGFDGAYAASWLDRLLGADDRRALRFRSLLIHPR
jgi:hypothetical protein